MSALILDDDATCRHVMLAQFTRLGCTDSVAYGNGVDALNAVSRAPSRFGLFVCDLQMPGMDGVEVLRELASLHYVGKVALVSGEDSRLLRAAARVAAARGLDVVAALKKPTLPVDIAALLCSAPPPAPLAEPCQRSPAALAEGIRAGQVFNLYQPIVDLCTGAVVGLLAVPRWLHPNHGLLEASEFASPEFAPGCAAALTRDLIVQALRAVRRWSQDGADPRVAVKVSIQALADLAFPEWLAQAAEAEAVPLQALVLEVAERRSKGDQRRTLDVLTRLRLRRVGLSIDAFGTGYSSIEQLRDAPFNQLKLGPGFIGGIAGDTQLQAIALGACAMAQSLDMRVVAGDVTCDADRVTLAACGVDAAHGSAIAPPLPAHQVLGWLSCWRGLGAP